MKLNLGNGCSKMEKYNPNLPIGKYYLSACKYAVREYILFKNELDDVF